METDKLKGQTMRAQDVRQAVSRMRALGEPMLGIHGGITSDGKTMLPELATVEALIKTLRLTRLALLQHERRIGVSWNAIEAATGTHTSTWRFRHRRGVLGE